MESYGNLFPERNENESLLAFETRLAIWDHEQGEQRTKERVCCFKEELMMNRWHPSRMDAALEQGIDVEDL